MDETSFDLSKELDRVIHILIDKLEGGIASDAEVSILPKLIKIRAGYLIYANDQTGGASHGYIDPFELAIKESRAVQS